MFPGQTQQQELPCVHEYVDHSLGHRQDSVDLPDICIISVSLDVLKQSKRTYVMHQP